MSDRMLPIAAEGWGFILVPLALAALLTWAGWIKTALGLAALAAFMAFFFRDPERAAPTTPRRHPGAGRRQGDGGGAGRG